MHQIPNRYHPFPTEDIQVGILASPAILSKDKKIAKYAPRVLNSYIMTYLNQAQTINALKRVKKIRKIQDDFPEFQHSKHQWRLLLQNKFKSVLVYDHKYYRWQALKKYKAFLNITHVSFLNNYLNRNLLRYLPGMLNIKYLEFGIGSDTNPHLLKKLNSMSFVLSKLKTFKMRCSHIPFNCETEHINLQKHLTHLYIQQIEEDEFFSILKQLSKNCKNLVFLSTSFHGLPSRLHCSYLELTKNFEKLEGITIFSNDLESFINNFTLPTSIKHISLNLGKAAWSNVYEELFGQEVKFFTPLLENSLTENKRLAKFFERWGDLTNLTSLKISAVQRWKVERIFIQAFLNLILKSVPNLVNFELDLRKQLFPMFEDEIDFDLSQLFHACQNYSDKLQEVKLSFPLTYSFICPSIEGVNFPNLTLLQLQNNSILDVKTIRNIFKLVKKPVLEEPKIVKILLSQIVVQSNEELLNLLETLLKAPRYSKTELIIEVEKLSLGTFDKMFEAFIERAPAIQNVSLKVKIEQKYKKALSFLNQVFQDIQFEEMSS